ncbi:MULTISPECIES: cytochrome P450 [unclassified Streptomyces]|uniref:cytochrome P450 n=1 Tax=unclassified Streptomyces TaxID=2593676 RepID=UPI0037B4D5E1
MTVHAVAGDEGTAEANAHFFAWLEKMRKTEPVSYNAETFQWSVFRHEDVAHIMANTAAFVSDMSDITPPQEDYDIFFRGNIAAMDEPRHRKFRMLVSKAFSARYIAGLETRLTQLATELLDAVGDKKEFDIAEDFAFPFPVAVIADILGAPAEDAPLFAEWANLLHASNAGVEGHRATAMRLKTLNNYMFKQIRERRAEPRDDLITTLVQAELDGRTLDDEEIVGFAGVLLMGGITTTAALISNIVLTFDRFPELYQQLRADRSLVPQAIEEVVRIRPSFSNFVRMTSEDVELGDQIIPAGELVHVWVSSANRDETAYPDPDTFDIHRDPNRHVGFGQGIHYCIGAPLARLESRIAFNLLLDRYEEIKVRTDQEIEFLDTSDMIGASRLPVTVRPV